MKIISIAHAHIEGDFFVIYFVLSHSSFLLQFQVSIFFISFSLLLSFLGGHNGLFKLPTAAADAQCRRLRHWLDRDNKSLITKIALMNFFCFVAFKTTSKFLFFLLYLSNGILFRCCVSNISWSVEFKFISRSIKHFVRSISCC